MQGLKGVRKARFALPGQKAPKEGGGGDRLIYYWSVGGDAIYMMTAFPKNERDDLSPRAEG